jgi:hypothetical protein
MAPGDAAVVAASVTAAITVLGADYVQAAGAALRGFIEGSLRRGTPVTPTSMSSWGGGTSPVLGAVQLSALGPLLDPYSRLRYRTPAAGGHLRR